MVTRANMIEPYRREDGQWDWRAIGGNASDIVATSGGQGYAHESAAIEAADRFGPQGFGVLHNHMILVQPGDRGYVQAIDAELQRQGKIFVEGLRARIVETIRDSVKHGADVEAIADAILNGTPNVSARAIDEGARERAGLTEGEKAQLDADRRANAAADRDNLDAAHDAAGEKEA